VSASLLLVAASLRLLAASLLLSGHGWFGLRRWSRPV